MTGVLDTLKTLKALPVSAAILNPSGTIIAVNDRWKDFGRKNGLRMPNFGVGSNYLQFCGSERSHFATDLRELLAGRQDLLTLIYPCHSPTKKRWFSLIGLPLSLNKPTGVALLHINFTDMLSLPIGARPARLEADRRIGVDRRVQPDRRRQIRTTANLDTISGAIEHSVLEILSSQLKTMFTNTSQGAAQQQSVECPDAEQILARSQLSKRQMEVLQLLGEGKTNKEIAEMLFRSPHTIKLHVSAILHQLKLKSRTQAALLASKLHTEALTGPAGHDVGVRKKTPTAVA